MQIHVAADPAEAASVAARIVERLLRSAIRLRGAATVAFSGGSTPALMLDELADVGLQWHMVTVFQVDERVAPDGDPDRNIGLLDALTRSGTTIVAMPVTAVDLERAAHQYAARLPARLDLVHLGIGDDGHTASWPPGDPVVGAPTTVAMSGEYRGRVRMTLTPLAVNAARARLVLAAGGGKAEPIRRWTSGDRSLPIAMVHRTGTQLVVDAAAASALALDR